MNDFIEVRGTSFAFEVRDGKKIEYAAGDRETRMRALGCPEEVLRKIRHGKRSAASKPAPAPAKPFAEFTEEDFAKLNGWTVEQYRARADYERQQRAHALGRQIAAQTDSDLRRRADAAGKVIASDALQEKKDAELRERMEIAAGRFHSRTCRGR